MSLVKRNDSKPAKKIRMDLGLYKYKFPEKQEKL